MSISLRATAAQCLALPVLVGLATTVCAQTAIPSPSLDPVVVTATRSTERLSDTLADLSVLNRTQIERSGARTIEELVSGLPGVEFARNGGAGGTASVFLRGGEARHAALFVDGVRVDAQTTGGAVWEQIPVALIDRVEVLRGPAAAVYGSDAVAGVIQVFTRRPEEGVSGQVGVSVGSHSTTELTGGVQGRVGVWDVSVSASHGRSEGFNARTDGASNPDRDGYVRRSGQARLGLQVSAVHRVEFGALTSKLRSRFDDSFVNNTEDVGYHDLDVLNFAWKAAWNAGSQSRMEMGQSTSTYETQPSFYRTENRIRHYLARHEETLGAHRVSATLERREDVLYNPATMWGEPLSGTRAQDALGLGWRGDFGPLGAQVHVRHDRDSEFSDKTTGGLAAAWEVAQGLRLTVGYATSFRAPTLYQRFSEYGNAGLRPESGRNLEVGVKWAQGVQMAQLTAWRNRVTDLINFGAAGPCVSAWGCYENAGRAELKGVTLAGATKLGAMGVRASMDFHDPRNRDTDKVLARRARYFGTLAFDLPMGATRLGAEVQGSGGRYDDSANLVRLGGYGLLNLTWVQTLTPSWSLQARIDNVLDKDHVLVSQYATPGRLAQVSLRGRF